MNDKDIPLCDKVLKHLAERQMKCDAVGCRWFFYQPKVPQKILDRYKKKD